MRQTNRPWLLIVPLLLLAFWWGARQLNADVLWFDEAKTVLYTGGQHLGPLSLQEITDNLRLYDPWQSPSYFYLLKAWSLIAGWSDFAGRYLSLLTGMGALAWVYQMGYTLAGRRVALLSMSTLLGASLFVHYLHEMRPYAQYMALSALTVTAYWRVVYGRGRRSHYALFFFGMAGLAYTHVLALFTALGISIYHVLFAPKTRRWMWVTLVAVVAGVAYLPWFTLQVRIFDLIAVDDIRQTVALNGQESVYWLLQAFSNGNIALLVLLAGASFWAWRDNVLHRALVFVWVWLTVVLVLVVILSDVVPAFIHVRYAMSAWVAGALVVALGVAQIGRRGVPIVAVMGLWVIVGIWTARDTTFYDALPNSHDTIDRADFVAMADVLAEQSHDDALFVIHSAPPNGEWQMDDTYVYYLHETQAMIRHMELIRPIAFEADGVAYQRAVREEVADIPVVWTGILEGIDYTRRRDDFFSALSASHEACGDVLKNDTVELQVWADMMQGTGMGVFGDGIEIVPMWDIPATILGDHLALLLGWRIDRNIIPADSYSVGVHLYDATGALVMQNDFGLPGGAMPCRYVQLDTVGLASGTYTVAMIAYDWQTGERLLTNDGEDRVVLGTVTN